MRHFLCSLPLLAALLIPTSSFAQEKIKPVGIGISVGIPDGAVLNVLVHPYTNAVHLDAGITYNAISPGVHFGATWDVFNYPISPSITAEYGTMLWPGSVPGVPNSPQVDYEYANFHLGLEVGSRKNGRFFIHAGPTYLHSTVSNLNAAVNTNGVLLSPGTFSGWIIPTAKLGFDIFF